jgi:hypothetical protein
MHRFFSDFCITREQFEGELPLFVPYNTNPNPETRSPAEFYPSLNFEHLHVSRRDAVPAQGNALGTLSKSPQLNLPSVLKERRICPSNEWLVSGRRTCV